jgi:hypothetical protein
MNTSEKIHPGNTKTVNAVLAGLPLPALGASTAGVVIGKKNAWKDMSF